MPVTVTIAGVATEYPDEFAAVAALLPLVPRHLRGPLRMQELLRRLNGPEPSGVLGANAVAVPRRLRDQFVPGAPQ